MERCAVDGRPDLGRRIDAVAGDTVDVEPLDGAFDVGVFGVLLVALGEDRVTDVEAESFEVLAGEVRREADEQVDVAVARQPRPAGGATDLQHVGVDRAVVDGRLSAVGESRRGGREPLALVGRRGDALADRRQHLVEGRHTPA